MSTSTPTLFPLGGRPAFWADTPKTRPSSPDVPHGHIIKAIRGRVTLQYEVVARLVREGRITSEFILNHPDPRWRASAKQRLRDCRRLGIALNVVQSRRRGAKQCTWYLTEAGRQRAMRLLAEADVRSTHRPPQAAGGSPPRPPQPGPGSLARTRPHF